MLCPIATAFNKIFFRIVQLFGAKHDSLIRAMAFWFLLPTEWLARFSFLLEVLVRLRRNRENFHILHVHETSWLAGVGVYLGKRWDIPVLCKVRNTPALDIIGYDTPWPKRWELLRHEAFFVALHSGLRSELIAEKIPPDRIAVIPNGVDIPLFAVEKRKDCEVVYVGNFTQGTDHKGFDILLTAWAKVYDTLPAAHLTMVGGGDRKVWERLARKLGCADSISFVGFVSDPDPFYKGASIFVLPSRHEGMSNALLEAQSWGIPAVVSDIPANCAVVEDGLNGKIVPVGDAQALATALLELLQHPEVRHKMCLAARERMEGMFSRKTVTDQIIALYRRLHAC
jgi:glycosyltransferase involved in cell wall biosynthesis